MEFLVMDKRGIINLLYIISFPMYGIGLYFSAAKSPSAGYVISIAPHLLILLFYFIDILYRGEFEFKINVNYFLMLSFILSSIVSLFVALHKGLPESSLVQMSVKSLLLIAPFHAFVVVMLYNLKKQNFLWLTLLSLSILLAINLIGFYILRLSNEVHSIEGRINFPFLDSFYSGATLLAIINLILLHYLKRAWNDPVRFALLMSYFIFNLALFFQINSRLTIIVLILVLGLFFFKLMRLRGIYLFSMFTIPILLSSGAIIYRALQQPGLSTLLQRVDVEDVTTFNGRAFLWKDAMDWLLNDQQGLIWGNGYKGHYFLGLISDVAKLWNEKDPYHMHLHSSSMEIMVAQGLIFFLVFAILFYQVYRYFKHKSNIGSQEGAFLPVVLFLLFLMQVDTFLYLDNLGFVFFSVLVAKIVIKENVQTGSLIRIEKISEILPHFKFPNIRSSILQLSWRIIH